MMVFIHVMFGLHLHAVTGLQYDSEFLSQAVEILIMMWICSRFLRLRFRPLFLTIMCLINVCVCMCSVYGSHLFYLQTLCTRDDDDHK